MARPAPVCVEANLIIALIVQEPASQRVDARWQAWSIENRRRIAPRVLPFEVARGIQRKVREGKVTRKDARKLLGTAENLVGTIELRKIND